MERNSGPEVVTNRHCQPTPSVDDQAAHADVFERGADDEGGPEVDPKRFSDLLVC